MDLIINIIAHILVVAFPGIIFLSLLLCFKDDLQCTVMVEGECLNIRKKGPTHSVQSVRYNIKFSYSYKSKKYECYSTEDFIRYPKQFIEGEIYPISINPRKPEIFRCAKKRHLIFDGARLTFMGIITLGVIFGVIKKLIEWI